MLIQFSVNNYHSIKDTITLNMLVSKSKNDKLKNFFSIRNYKLLRSAVIYGANASGKSNIIKAMAFMRNFVLNTFKIIQSTDKLPHEPFKLSTETENSSTTFEIIFFKDNIKFRYGFEYDSDIIYSEWLFSDEKGKEAKLFTRDVDEGDYVNREKFKEGLKFFDRKNERINISKNQLFIWKCDQENGKISKSILDWFKDFNVLDGVSIEENITLGLIEKLNLKKEVVELVKTGDIDIDDIVIEEEEIDNFNTLPDIVKRNILLNKAQKISKISINTKHKKYNKNGNVIGKEEFDLSDESTGTKKLFSLAAPIIDTLQNGKVLVIDELEVNLHPILTQNLIKLFNDENVNKKNAQLIFTTHDTNLLKPSIFRRDQIWFSEKNKFSSTEIYSLVEFKGVRASEDFEKQYIQGKYGAIPYIGKFEF
jgi:AAA15 family ATPase/GTPase